MGKLVNARILAVSTIAVGILLIAISIASMIFLYQLKASVNLNTSTMSEDFYLTSGKKYGLYAVGSDYPEGYMSGTIHVINENGYEVDVISFSVSFNDDSDDDSTIVMNYIADLQVPVSGMYHIIVEVSSMELYSGRVVIEVHESLILSLFGVNETFTLLIGFALIVFPVIILTITYFKSKRTPLSDTAPTTYENELMIAQSPYGKQEDGLPSGSTGDENLVLTANNYEKEELSTKDDISICPNCGNHCEKDSLFCEQCGMKMR